ncbi:MAG TPA: uroporphyrinogen decarboxylase [bacterium]|nr:uroporphyrinogen decarboxylase [bacterium]
MTPKDRFLKACRREEVDRPPVWMMRQAGRYLPEYREIRKSKSTLEMMKDPATACEITLQPVRRLGVDAAILYSDILIVPEAMGLKLDFVRDVGPVFDRKIENKADAHWLREKDVPERCPFVFETIKRIRKELSPDIPLLGFAGAPFTVGAYMAGGDGSYDGARIKKIAYQHRDVFRTLMEKVALATMDYLKAQVAAGVDAVQLFDTWAGTLTAEDYRQFALPYAREILKEVKSAGVPAILYIKGGSHLFDEMKAAGPDVISIDWRMDLTLARERAKGEVAIQGNFDPARLYAPPEVIRQETRKMIDAAGGSPGYLVNLGHGILEDVPVENAQAFVDAAKNHG